jgi:hypothetical protein
MMGLLDWGYYLFEGNVLLIAVVTVQVTGNQLESLFEIASIIAKGPSKLFVSRKVDLLP